MAPSGTRGVLVGYRRSWLRGDLLAGVTVAAHLVPQVMAYAGVAGLPPVAGLWAILPALALYALLGSSRLLSVGPESTTALMTATVVAPARVEQDLLDELKAYGLTDSVGENLIFPTLPTAVAEYRQWAKCQPGWGRSPSAVAQVPTDLRFRRQQENRSGRASPTCRGRSGVMAAGPRCHAVDAGLLDGRLGAFAPARAR